MEELLRQTCVGGSCASASSSKISSNLSAIRVRWSPYWFNSYVSPVHSYTPQDVTSGRIWSIGSRGFKKLKFSPACPGQRPMRNIKTMPLNKKFSIVCSIHFTPQKSESSCIIVDNESSSFHTIIQVDGTNRSGIMQIVTAALRDLGLLIQEASVDVTKGIVHEKFFVTDVRGKKLLDGKDLQNIERVLLTALDQAPAISAASTYYQSPRIHKTPEGKSEAPEVSGRTSLLHKLMDQYLQKDVYSIQKSIMDHVEYTIARSRFKCDDFETYQATAYSVRDHLIESWNDTQQFYRDLDPKRVYYLSMEFLMGRSLLNSIFNLGIKDQYAEALKELGYDLEVLVEQERDAALGNGGLGRLAACFLDSLATLDYSAWGYASFEHNIRMGCGLLAFLLKTEIE